MRIERLLLLQLQLQFLSSFLLFLSLLSSLLLLSNHENVFSAWMNEKRSVSQTTHSQSNDTQSLNIIGLLTCEEHDKSVDSHSPPGGG